MNTSPKNKVRVAGLALLPLIWLGGIGPVFAAELEKPEGFRVSFFESSSELNSEPSSEEQDGSAKAQSSVSGENGEGNKNAENQSDKKSNPEFAEANNVETTRLENFRRAAKKLLLTKLNPPNGDAATIYVMAPFNDTNLTQPQIVATTIADSMKAYDGSIRVRTTDQTMSSLTLESFRKTVAKLGADIILMTVLNAGHFEMYLYDKRTPRQIYAHTEALASTARYQLSEEVAKYYTKVLLRRTLFTYLKNQFYEMPREELQPFLQSEIPRYIASPESIHLINREVASHFYASGGLGTAISSGVSNKFWNSNLLSAELAVRVFGKWYLEASMNMFAYNAVSGSIKYLFSDRESSFKVLAGLGVSRFLPARQVLNWDQSNGGLEGHNYVVPSATFLLPISDVYLKAETQLYMPIRSSNRYVFTIMPGILLMF